MWYSINMLPCSPPIHFRLVIPALFNFVEAADTIARLEGLLSSDSQMDNAVWLNCFAQVNQVCRFP